MDRSSEASQGLNERFSVFILFCTLRISSTPSDVSGNFSQVSTMKTYRVIITTTALRFKKRQSRRTSARCGIVFDRSSKPSSHHITHASGPARS